MTTQNAPTLKLKVDGAFLHENLTAWYRKNKRPLPWRILFDKKKDPWLIWVSEIMLQQTVIKAVIPVYSRFLRLYPNPSILAQEAPENVRLAVRGLGYYRRFDLLHKACKHLQTLGAKMPTSHNQWLALPGIGAYTAAAIASITNDEPHGVVDGNVERVLCRLFDIRTAPNLPYLKKEFKKIMDDLCQRGESGNLNQSVMELGQVICTPQNPNCKRCPISKKCLAFKRTSQAFAPAPKAKQIPLVELVELQILQKKSMVGLFQRPHDAKFMKNTWGFPTFIRDQDGLRADGQHEFRPFEGNVHVIGEIKHTITKHKITAKITAATTTSRANEQKLKFLPKSEIEKNLVSNLDRKAWTKYLANIETH